MAQYGLASDAWIQFLIFSKYPVIISDLRGAVLNIHENQITRTMGLHSFKDFAEMVVEIKRRISLNTDIPEDKKNYIIREVAKHWNRSTEWGISVSKNKTISDDLMQALDLYIRTIYPICGLEDFPFLGLMKKQNDPVESQVAKNIFFKMYEIIFRR
jgi:hypothetical protein